MNRFAVSLFVIVVFVALGAKPTASQSVGESRSSVPALHMTPAERDLYEHAATLFDWSPRQIKSVPFLHGLHLAEDQRELPVILDRVGKTAVRLYHDFPKVACDEAVYSETSQKNPLASWGGMSRNHASHHFRYIVIPKLVGEIMAFEEYRTDSEGKPLTNASLDDLKMITSNFSSSWTYFSPPEQNDSRFRYFGTQSIEKRECFVVGFAQRPETAHNVSGFRLEDGSAVLLVQGIAWIDKESFEILRINTWLLASREDIGLQADQTVVDYSPILPEGYERTLWLPRDVTVTILFRNEYFRNTHRYSNFKLFRVESTIKPAE